jgi:hypothetical protein
MKGHILTAAAQRAWAAETAFVRSEPLQAPTMQLVTLLTKVWLLQRQTLSVAEQPPRSAFVMQVVAQSI